MICVELRFPVIGKSLPSDHGYAMFSAMSKIVPETHQADWLAVETVPGTARGDGAIYINERARLSMRLPQERLPLLLRLAGKRLDVSGYPLRLGAPQIFLLKPSTSLYARCVTIKKFMEPERFIDAVCRKLDDLGVNGEPEIGARRAFRVGNHTIVGFGLKIHELSEEASIVIQERGIGGRRHMGCGYFVPIAEGKPEQEG